MTGAESRVMVVIHSHLPTLKETMKWFIQVERKERWNAFGLLSCHLVYSEAFRVSLQIISFSDDGCLNFKVLPSSGKFCE